MERLWRWWRLRKIDQRFARYNTEQRLIIAHLARDAAFDAIPGTPEWRYSVIRYCEAVIAWARSIQQRDRKRLQT